MNHQRWKLWLLFLGLVAGPAGVVAAKEGAWSTENLLAALIRQQGVLLDMTHEQAGCSSAPALPGRKHVTLGDYLAFLTASLDEKNGQSGVSSTCKFHQAGDKTQCTVMFRTGVGVDPWAYGIRFIIDDHGKIDPKSLTCPGGS